MHASATFTLLTLVAGAFAAPADTGSAERIAKRIAPNYQSCSATSHWFSAAYGVNIGAAYNGGVGCNDVFGALAADVWVTNWQCVDDGSGNTQLYFNAPQGEGSKLNNKLQSMYPNIIGGFNCPDS